MGLMVIGALTSNSYDCVCVDGTGSKEDANVILYFPLPSLTIFQRAKFRRTYKLLEPNSDKEFVF